MLFTMLRQSFFQGWRRKTLTAVTVALAATLISALFTLTVDVGDKMAREMKSYGSNIKVTPKSEAMPLVIGGIDYNPLKGRDYLNEADLPKIKDIFWRNNIVGLSPWLTLRVEAAPADRPSGGARISLTGAYFSHLTPLPDDSNYRTGVRTTAPFWQVEGDWPSDEAMDEAMTGRALAARLGLKIGDWLIVTPPEGEAGAAQRVRLTGILTTGGHEDEAVLAPMALAQALGGLKGKVQSVEVSALTIPENALSNKARRDTTSLSAEEYDTWYCTAYVSSIAHQIEEAVPNASARPIWQVAASEGAVIGRIQALLLLVSVAAVAAAAMGVSALMNATISERAREIGLQKALGASPTEINLLFLSEAAIVGLIGGAIGVLLGAGLVQVIGWSVFHAGVELRAIAIPLTLAASVAIVLVGAILPTRSIGALMPVDVLHGRR